MTFARNLTNSLRRHEIQIGHSFSSTFFYIFLWLSQKEKTFHILHQALRLLASGAHSRGRRSIGRADFLLGGQMLPQSSSPGSLELHCARSADGEAGKGGRNLDKAATF